MTALSEIKLFAFEAFRVLILASAASACAVVIGALWVVLKLILEG